MSGNLKNKVCLITGAARGIGKGIVEEFLNEGAVVYANTRNIESFENLQSSIALEHRNRLFSAVFDINETANTKKAIQMIRKASERIDVLVNNAAVAYNEKIGMISTANMEVMFKTNVISTIVLTQLVARIMIRQKSGSIINIASVVGEYGDAGQSAYSATKGAIISFTKSASKELAPMQIRVNAVSPGLTDTDMFRSTDKSLLHDRIDNIKMGRVADIEDIAKACVFFASDNSCYITGQILGVNGGSVI